MTRWLLLLVCAALVALQAGALAPASAQLASDTAPAVSRQIAPVVARDGMVVAQVARAARVGAAILARGGNAVDAAVATGFALAVTYPRAGNLGGGGYMVIHLADRAISTTIDYRETAPAAITRDSFLDEHGEADPRKSRDSALAIGVPGTVAGLALAHARYGSGRLTLADLIAPAIALARDGIPIEDDIADSLPRSAPRLARWPSTLKIFFDTEGRPLAPGALLRQPDLAETLAAIAAEGPSAFYQGVIGDRLAAAVRAAGGVMTRADFGGYKAIERAPIRGSYRGYDILSMPPSSSGGVILLEILNILEGFDLEGDDARRIHLMVEAMKHAYADRAAFLGDPKSVEAPLARLTSKSYAAQLRSLIDPSRATPAQEIHAGGGVLREGDNTTHYSVVDRSGNAVSTTTTLNFSYGVGLVAEGTGILLNNELDDFAAKPGVPNAFGLLGGEANAPGPGKRPLSSMSPTIVLKDGKPILVTGSPGGSRIITAVVEVVSTVIDRKMPVDQAVAELRFHHQWQPDELIVERGFSPALIEALRRRGQVVVERNPGTSANSIAVTEDGLVGAADNRTRGALAVGN
ncbi:MAG: gamma-glutamyltransferase [Hyphomicrobiales bacterium]|nr:gamma-glutamyltransferase [Hyphomicrobiales bacterium]